MPPPRVKYPSKTFGRRDLGPPGAVIEGDGQGRPLIRMASRRRQWAAHSSRMCASWWVVLARDPVAAGPVWEVGVGGGESGTSVVFGHHANHIFVGLRGGETERAKPN